LIGDLVNGATTPVGRSVTNILQGTESAESHEAGYRPAPFMSRACRKDTCCIWSHISRALTASFTGRGGRCNKWARAAIRLGFHDAGTWSKSLASRGQDFGGADGSIVLSGQEKGRPENKGLEEIIEMARRWQRIYGVGMGDLIQFAAIHAVVTCPLGPRIRFFAGRKDSSRPAPDGLLPGVFASADSLINLFEDKTISPHELAALLGAHSTSKQFFIDPRKSGAPQDSTPGVWDTLFYNQTTAGKTPSQVFKFQSDVVLAQDPRIKSEWESFAGQGGQEHWNEDYARAYTRLSLLGVNNINGLTECSKVLPAAKRGF
ncbi:class II peroxidase, partial [Patellaria atrata CBS 101060]